MNIFEDNDDDLKYPNSYYNSFEEMYTLSLKELEAMLEYERPYAIARLKKAGERTQKTVSHALRKTNKSTRKSNDHKVLHILSNAHTALGYTLQEWNRICLMERVVTRKQGEEKKAKRQQKQINSGGVNESAKVPT